MVTSIFSAYFDGHVITIATVKVKLIPDFCNWTIVLTKQIEEIGEKQLLVFGLIGVGWGLGQNNNLMYIPLSCSLEFRTNKI